MRKMTRQTDSKRASKVRDRQIAEARKAKHKGQGR